MGVRRSLALCALFAATALPRPAAAQAEAESQAAAFTLDLVHKSDVMAVRQKGGPRGVRYLDNTDLIATFDFDRAIGWQGGSGYVGVLNNNGRRPNDIAGTLQGVDNIEVARSDIRLYQAWVQQSFADGRASVLVGKYDLNSEFYASPAAGLLIAPAFGIGSELASTGPNGPSIFPQTDLALRLGWEGERYYVRSAVVRAPRGTVDGGGRRAALLIAEVGLKGRTALSIGGWSYSRRQPRITPPGVTFGPDRAASHGVYTLVEQVLAGEPEQPGSWSVFLRAGLSDGKTTPFGGGVQAGVTGLGVFRGRPDSAVSLGFATGGLSNAYRRANPPGEPALVRSEDMVELTYSDRVAPFLTLQPDVQYVRRPSGLRDGGGVLVVGLRAIIDWKIK